MNAKSILFASLLLACSKEEGGKAKPAKQYFDNVSTIESLGFTIDRPAGVKLGEVQKTTPHSDCCKEVEVLGPDGKFLGRIYTTNAPHFYKTLEQHLKETHDGDSIVKQELLPSGAYYVEYRLANDSPKSPARIRSSVTTERTSASCDSSPFEEEMEIARALCRSLRPKASSASAAAPKSAGG
jgi:hypothetical protein